MSGDPDDLFGSNIVNQQTRGRLQQVFTSFDEPSGSLSYVPKKKETSPETAILFANPACHLYILESGKFVPQGKVGVAIIGKTQSDHYHILCYKSNTEFLCSATIFDNFSFKTNQHYSYFYDDNQRAFSLLFKSPEDAIQFTQYISIAKFKLSDGKNTVFTDLGDATGKTMVAQGSKVQISYTGWLLTKSEYNFLKLGNQFDSNVNSGTSLIFTIGENNVIKGLEEGLIGAKVGMKRFLVIPPHLAYGDSDANKKIPPHSILCFQIEVLKVKSKGKEEKPSPMTPPPVVNSPRDDTMNRIAKMGTQTVFQMLEPKVDHIVTPQPQPLQPQVVQPLPVQEVVQQQVVQPQAVQPQVIHQQQPQVIYTTNPQVIHQIHQSQPQMIAQPQMMTSSYSTLDTIENLKKQIQQLSDMVVKKETPQVEEKREEVKESDKMASLILKVDQLTSKIDNMDLTTLLKSKDRDQKERLMSAPVLLQNIQHLIDMNEKFRREIAEERSTIDNLNDKIQILRKKASEKLDSGDDYAQRELESANSKINKLNVRVLELQENLEKEREGAYLLKKKFDAIESQHVDVKSELEKYRKNYEKLNTEFSEREIEFRNKYLNLQQEFETFKHNSSTFAQEKEKLNLTISTNHGEIERLKVRLEETATLLEASQKQVDFEKKKHVDYIRDQGASKNEILAEVESEREKRNEVEKRLKEVETQFKKLKEAYGTLNDEKFALEQSLESTSEEKSVFTAKFEVKASQLIQKHKQELEDMENSHEEKLLELKALFKEKMSEIQTKQMESIKEDYCENLKGFMSQLYFAIQSKLEGESKYTGSKFLGLLGKTIKSATAELMKAIEEDTMDELELEKDENKISDDEEEEGVQNESGYHEKNHHHGQDPKPLPEDSPLNQTLPLMNESPIKKVDFSSMETPMKNFGLDLSEQVLNKTESDVQETEVESEKSETVIQEALQEDMPVVQEEKVKVEEEVQEKDESIEIPPPVVEDLPEVVKHEESIKEESPQPIVKEENPFDFDLKPPPVVETHVESPKPDETALESDFTKKPTKSQEPIGFGEEDPFAETLAKTTPKKNTLFDPMFDDFSEPVEKKKEVKPPSVSNLFDDL